jgi:hypothetical protein
MKTFQDTAGRTWTIAVNIDAVKRVRDLLNIHLNRIGESNFKPLDDILSDPVTLVDVVFVLCKPEADAKGVSDSDFGKAMSGDAIFAAAEAFVEELADFFPSARARRALKALIAKGRDIRDRMLDQAEAQIARIDPVAEATSLIESFGRSPGSSASTPAR